MSICSRLILSLLCFWLLPTSSVFAQSCKKYGDPVKTGDFHSKKVDESSGLAASRKYPGVWWTHNDSGGKARIFAFDETGKSLGIYEVKGAKHVDWEDLAAGPCPDGSHCLFVGDIGDNSKKRTTIQLYRFPEPKVDRKNPKDGKSESADVFTLKYPDGAHDSETLVVHPKTGDIFLYTKALLKKEIGIYRLSGKSQPGQHTLEKVGEIEIPGGLLTGGDMSPHGDQLVIRDYFSAYIFTPGANGIPKDKDLLVKFTLATTQQGEAIAYSLDGQNLFTTTEKVPSPIHKYPCVAAPAPEKTVDEAPATDSQQDAGGIDGNTGTSNCGCQSSQERGSFQLLLFFILLTFFLFFRSRNRKAHCQTHH